MEIFLLWSIVYRYPGLGWLFGSTAMLLFRALGVWALDRHSKMNTTATDAVLHSWDN